MEQGAAAENSSEESDQISDLQTAYEEDKARPVKQRKAGQSVSDYLDSIHEIKNSKNSTEENLDLERSNTTPGETSDSENSEKKGKKKQGRKKKTCEEGAEKSDTSPTSSDSGEAEAPDGASEQSDSKAGKRSTPATPKPKRRSKRRRGSDSNASKSSAANSEDDRESDSQEKLKDSEEAEKKEKEKSDSNSEDSASRRIKASFLTRNRPRKQKPLWRQILGRGKTEMAALGSLFFMAASMLLQIHGKVKVERLLQRSAPKPVPLFGPNSLVEDHYQGTGADVFTILSKAEITLIAYYAPWCAQCHELRWQLDQLARHFPPNQVKFLAVNCWDPGGRCKQLYRMYTFPVLAVYPASSQAVFYNGPYTADYLYRFLTSVINPLERLNSQEEITEFMMSTDVCVIAFFDFQTYEEPQGYRSYQAAAVRALERDPQRWVRFGVVTNRDLAHRALQMDSSRQTHLYSLTSQRFHSYPYRNRSYKAVEIVKWIFGQFESWKENKPLGYWLPTGETFGQKSEQLGAILSNRPTAILFTPREPLWEDLGPSKIYAAFREAAQDYWDCQDKENPHLKSRLADARKETIKRELNRRNSERDLPEDCRAVAKRQKQLKDCCHDVVLTTVTVAPHRNICDFCNPVLPKVPLTYLGKAKKPEIPGSTQAPHLIEDSPRLPNPDATASLLKSAIHIHSCDSFDGVVPAPSLVKYCCHTGEPFEKEAGLPHKNSEDLPLAQTRRFATLLNEGTKTFRHCAHTTCGGKKQPSRELIDSCLKLRLSKTLGYSSILKNPSTRSFKDGMNSGTEKGENNSSIGAASITGLGCETNKTLTFIAVDSRSYSWLRTRIIGENSAKNLRISDSTLVIVQNSSESIYWLPNPSPDAEDIQQFFRDFQDNSLVVHRRGESKRTKAKQSITPNSADDSMISLMQVNRGNFEKIVLDPRKDVVLFYTGEKWCGFCQGVYHVLLTAVAYFRGLQDRLIFAQVDTSVNDLDIPYMVDRFPSIIMYPAYRKSNSVAFPSFLPMTLPNLLSFILANAHPEIRWRVALGNCGPRCSSENRLQAILRLQTLRSEIRILKSRMAGISFSAETWNEQVVIGEESTNVGAVYMLLLRKELTKKEVQRRTLRSLLRLSRSLGKARDLLSLKTDGEKAALLELLIKNNDWLSLSSFANRNGSQRLLIR